VGVHGEPNGWCEPVIFSLISIVLAVSPFVWMSDNVEQST